MKGKVFRGHDADETHPQGPGNARIKRRDGKGGQLIPKQVNADDLSRQIPVPDGHKGAAHAAANQVAGIDYGQHHHEKREKIEPLFRVDEKTTDGRRRYVEAASPMGQTFPVNKDEFKDKLGRQGGNAEIEPFNPKGRNTDDESGNGCHDTGTGQRSPERKTEFCDQDGGGITADAGKGCVPQGNLPGKSREDVESDGGDDGEPDHIGHIQEISVGHKGKDQQEHQKKAQTPLDKQGLENFFVLDVGFSKIATSHGYVPIWYCL